MSHGGPNHVAGEHRRNHQIQIGLFIVFIIVWVLESFVFRFTSYVYIVPFFVNIVPGIVIVIAALYLLSRSHIVFEGPEPYVVDHGVYARMRHPMYFGSILLYVGFWVATLSLFTLIPLVAVIIGYNYLANAEERLLEAKFGDEYREYKKRVPKFIPH